MWGFISLGLIGYLLFCDHPIEFKLGLAFVAALFAMANGLANISYRLGKINDKIVVKKESKDEN